jgi:arylsulfatase A-like enzyme
VLRSFHNLRPHSLGLALGIFVLAAALPSCGPDTPLPLRLAVVDRSLSWQLSPSEAPSLPLSLDWTFEGQAAGGDPEGWQLPGGRPVVADHGALVASGQGRVVLLSPPGAPIDGEVHHWLSWAARTENVDHVIVSWRGPGQAFSPNRATSPLKLSPPKRPQTSKKQGLSSEFQSFTLPLSSLRGVRDSADASEGLEQLKLTFVGDSQQTTRVELDRLSCVSDYDQKHQESLAVHELQRDGERRHGVVLRAGRSAKLSLTSGTGDRLRVALAATGASSPLHVTLNDPSGRLSPSSWTLKAGEPWRPFAIDLPDSSGQPLELNLSCAPHNDPRAALLVGGPLHLAPRPDLHPNVLLYVEDTLRRDRLSVYGHERLTDPALAVMAAEGVVFEDTLAASSWTRPSISSLLTSLRPLAHGNGTHLDRVSAEVTTLAEAFADAGYLTASFVTNYHGGAWSGLDQGFDIAREPTADGASSVASTLTSSAIAESIARLLREHVGERLFVHVHTLDPHEPYRPEAEDLAALNLAELPPSAAEHPPSLLYEAEVRHNDRHIEGLFSTLKELHLSNKTLFAFTSDHGEAFNEHGLRGHRQSLHREELDVPLVLRWPAGLPAGQRVAAPVAHIDLAPTLLALAGIERPTSWQGRDLSALARGEAASAADHPRLAHCSFAGSQIERPDEVAAVMSDRRGARFKLIAALNDEGELTSQSLFRLDHDPGELQNLVGEGSPDTVEVLRAMISWLQSTVAEDLSMGLQASAEPMDPATREWMQALGYLGH